MALFQRLLSTLALAIMAGTAAQAETPLRSFEPSTDWVLDYAEDSCALRRSYTDEDGRTVYVDMRQFAPKGFVTFTIYSADLDRMPEKVRYRFEPDEDYTDVGHAFAIDSGEDIRGFRFNGDYLREADRPEEFEDFVNLEPEVFMAREREISGFVVLEGFEVSMLLRTGSLLAPMNAMRTCMDELLAHLGIDPEAQRSLSRRPELYNRAGLAQSLWANFPRAMIRDRQSATMQVRLIVGDQGRVSNCSIIGLVGQPDYGEATCDTFSRYVRFTPALDAEGQPIASIWITDLSYWTR